MKILNIIIISCILCFSSCQKNSEQTDSQAKTEQKSTKENTLTKETSKYLIKVDDKEMKINKEMYKYIDELKTKTKKWKNNNAIDYHKAQEDLKVSLNHLMSHCDIQDEDGHEHLQQYILPVKENIELLDTEKEKSLKIIQSNLDNIKLTE